MEKNSIIYKGLEDIRTIEWKDILSDCRKKHTKEDFDQAMLAGTSFCRIRESNMLSSWKKPWIFFQAGKIGIAIIACLYVSVILPMIFGIAITNALYWMVIIIPPLVMPIVLLTFFWEMNVPRNVSLLQVLAIFLAGAILSMVFTGVMFGIVENNTSAGFAAFREEPAKLAAGLLLLWLWSKLGNKKIYGFTGLLIGAAVGAGFGAFESMEYGISNYYLVMTANDINILRAILALGGHTVMVAPYLAALALEMNDHTWKLKINSLFLQTFATSTALHFIWNTQLTNNSTAEYLKLALVTFLFWVQVLKITKLCFLQVMNNHQVSLSMGKSIQMTGISGNLRGINVSVACGRTIYIGREDSCAFKVPSTTQGVSRKHCMIFSEDNGEWYVVDQNSTFGTYLNSIKLEPGKGYRLRSQDILCLGSESQKIRIIL